MALRFLRECPWDRLDALREAVPDIPFQVRAGELTKQRKGPST